MYRLGGAPGCTTPLAAVRTTATTTDANNTTRRTLPVWFPTPPGASLFLLFPLPRPLAVLTRDEGDQASARQRSHLEITRRRQKVVGVDSTHLLRGRQFPKLAPTRSRGHWCWYRLGGWKPGPHRCPDWFPVRNHGTAGCARPAAAVYPFTDRASPHCAHPGGRSVRFRTSFPTRRPARPDPVVGDR